MSLVNTVCALVAAAVATGIFFYAAGALLDVSYRVVAALVDRRRSGPPPP